ncbi:hypothetical protein N801_11015 [Knoellia aerolata DSM 18566]|uniref:Uncharacterized protein n=2 Tax=Knoellia TaxID=136099 RepID=A0A0A0JXP2_9MICO|nr:hypothetical protein N801_11015 [Knoellia aerolata DSM 18566]
MRASERTAYPTTVASAAAEDGRALALELAGMSDPQRMDVLTLRIVTEPDEDVLRVAMCWARWRVDGQWGESYWCQGIVTTQRLLLRLPDGSLRSQWWGTVVGFDADLEAGHVVLDYGDGRPRQIAGPAAAVVAVAGINAIYGTEALIRHPSLEPLRAHETPSRG